MNLKLFAGHAELRESHNTIRNDKPKRQQFAFWNNFTCLYCLSFHNSTKRERILLQVVLASIHVCLEPT